MTTRRLACWASVALTSAVMLTTSFAQQGHPLVGSWSGDWGTGPEERNRVLLLLEYDGERISGVINPGRASVVLTSASLDPSTWAVRLEAAASEHNGGIHYLIEGHIENLGSITERTIVGTWIQGERQGDFRIVMN